MLASLLVPALGLNVAPRVPTVVMNTPPPTSSWDQEYQRLKDINKQMLERAVDVGSGPSAYYTSPYVPNAAATGGMSRRDVLPLAIGGGVLGAASLSAISGVVNDDLPLIGGDAGAAAAGDVTMEEVINAQRAWADSLVDISQTYLKGGDYVSAAAKAAGELYAYGESKVLFKPTKAAENPFRPTAAEALSYFVGGDQVPGQGYKEDSGFALNYGKGFKRVVFDNHQVDLNGKTAVAMGEYYFYSAGADGGVAKVEYTFGYKRCDDGKIRIYVHHSSLPFAKKPKVLAPITMEEVVAAQKAWGDAIVRISSTYLKGGDYVAVAAEAADQLYGYGRSNVLFKPTKASEYPFRPTGAEALSYFIGGDKVPEGGYAEDKGFALNYGNGFKKVVLDNHQIDFNGATAQAMGEYYFYSAAEDGGVAKVEYTFGYKRNDDGKIRIYLHHSSLPYKPHK